MNCELLRVQDFCTTGFSLTVVSQSGVMSSDHTHFRYSNMGERNTTVDLVTV